MSALARTLVPSPNTGCPACAEHDDRGKAKARASAAEQAMHHFDYRDGVLHAEGVDLVGLAEAVGTPFYCYSDATLARHYAVFAGAFGDVRALVCYAMKANSNQAVVATLARLGAGADVVSGGELKRALAPRGAAGTNMFSRV